jgi:putative oxidoreductase
MKKRNTTLCISREVRAQLTRYATLPLRLNVGYSFLEHGLAKWSKGTGAFAAILHAAGVPAPHLMAWITIATEVLGGVAILLGAFVSLVSIPAITLLIVAIVTVHLPYGFSSIKLMSFSNGLAHFGPPGYECALLYIASIVALVLSDPSPWSVDSWRRHQNRTASLASEIEKGAAGSPHPKLSCQPHTSPGLVTSFI